MAFKMNSSPVKILWPWSKKAKEKRRFRDFEKGTYVDEFGKTHTKEGYEIVDGNLQKISRREQRKRDRLAEQEHYDRLSELSDEELMDMHSKRNQ